MKKHAWLVAVLVCLGSTLAAGCGEVESCREAQTPGCINTAPRADGTCLFDLVLRAGKCVKSGSDDDKCGLCAPGSLCVPEQNACVNFCAIPTAIPGSVKPPQSIFCEAFIQAGAAPGSNPMLSFSDVCTRRCRLTCQRLEQYCTGYTCPAGACDQPEVQAKCAADCPPLASGGQDLACLTRSCNDARFTLCDKASCPSGSTSHCGNLTCSNSCAFQINSQAVVGDGICDDGDVLSSMSNDCAWGTDCADCGPRAGTHAPALGVLGDLCQYTANCAGASGKPSDATAWCVELQSTGVSRCMPDCSRGQKCAKGFTCYDVTFPNATTMTAMNVTEGDLIAGACIPDLCQ
ncbi:MAG: hypothetical protein JWN04_5902 [Myxococcaceae bacterium]|nr:hypothetical protein [Myxococcaceae bacterium]